MINFRSRRDLFELRFSSFFTTRQERERLLREVMGAGQELIRFEALERTRSYLEREITGQDEMIFQLSHELEVVQTQFTLIRWNLLRLDKEEVEMMREIVLREAERQQLVREIRLAQGTNLTVPLSHFQNRYPVVWSVFHIRDSSLQLRRRLFTS